MEKFDLCRICLSANVHHAINNTDLEIIYEKLTAMPFQTNDMRPLSVCYTCHTQLQDTKELMLKCLTAETRLIEMMNQLADTKEEADDKATLMDRLKLSSALSVSPIVTVCSTNVDHTCGEVDAEIKQEHDVDDADDEADFSDITIGPTMIGSQQVLDEQEQSLAVSCKSEEPHGTRATAAGAGDDCGEHAEYLHSFAYEMPVRYHPELELQIREESVSKLFNEKKITPSANVNSKPDMEQYQFNSNLDTHNKTQESVSNKSIDIAADSVCNRRLSNVVKPLTDPSGCDRILTGDKSFTCKVCFKSFTRKTGLTSHIRIHTGDRSSFSCNVCNKSFTSKQHLARHIRTHTGVKPFTCKVCFKSFTRKNCLTSHIRVHAADRSFTCKLCSKSLSTKISLERHILTHSDEKPFSCNVCIKRFQTKQNLANHLRSHTGDRPFTCSVCNKSLNSKRSLINHIRIHTGDKAFTCDVCSKSFTTKHNLISHILNHKGDRSFTCNVCCKIFIGRQHLESHFCGVIPYL